MTKTNIEPHHIANYCKGPVTTAYERKVASGEVRRDEFQVALVKKLDVLHETLASLPPVPLDPVPLDIVDPNESASTWRNRLSGLLSKCVASASSFLQKKSRSGPLPRGMYIHGPVGIGKSFLMDLFFASVPDAHDAGFDNNHSKHPKVTKRRVHFNEFMLDVHHRIFVYKQEYPRGNAIAVIAQQLAQEAQLLCFDEFQVTDIGDAMILKRLFLQLMELNVLVVATSNRPPDALYEGGINRSLFLPFIDTLKQSFDIISMEDSRKDYRRETQADGQSYFWTNGDIQDNNNIDNNINMKLEEIFGGSLSDTQDKMIPVLFGRYVRVTRSNDRCAWFDFEALCHQPLGAADYISLCNRFQLLIIEQVPQLNANHLDEARRFVTLIDACYESRTRLVLAANVPLDKLFVDFEAQVESRDGDEELFVNDKGGNSSAFATTMIRRKDGKDMEWSATGLIGVSLAQLSAANDVAFSFQRAASRLVEMGGKAWGRCIF